jgi:hypothetical protein
LAHGSHVVFIPKTFCKGALTSGIFGETYKYC